MATLSEAAAWRLVYELPPKPKPPTRLSVCFTGFTSAEKTELMALAHEANHHIAGGVTKKLGLLVCGDNAGPVKLEKAAAQGVTLMTGEEYRELLREDPEKVND